MPYFERIEGRVSRSPPRQLCWLSPQQSKLKLDAIDVLLNSALARVEHLHATSRGLFDWRTFNAATSS